jgi:hypothetical protein
MGKQITISEIDEVLSFDTYDESTIILLSSRIPEGTVCAVPDKTGHDSQYRMMFACAAAPEVKAGRSAKRDHPRPAK